MFSTYLWQESPRQPYYRIQTDDPAVARKLRRRTTTTLSGFGINCRMWQFVTSYKSPKIAQNSIQRITGQKPEKDAVSGVLVSYTGSILTSKETS